MKLKKIVRKSLWKIGYDLTRFSPMTNPVARRRKLLKTFNIDVVLDVGANTGQSGLELRKDIGYTGRIVSFEPLSAAYKKLEKESQNDPEWTAINCGLGEIAGKKQINIAGNSYSSSILDMLDSHLKAAPESRYIDQEIIEIRTLDSVFSDYCSETDIIYLKIDTQGYEDRVIKGAEDALKKIGTIQLEMSLVPIYKDGPLFDELHRILTAKGYCLVSLETELTDPESGQLLVVNGIYHNFKISNGQSHC